MLAFMGFPIHLSASTHLTLTPTKRAQIILICFCLMLVVIGIDLLGAFHLPTTTYYVIPILIVAWMDSGIVAVWFAVLTVFLWMVARITLSGAPLDATMLLGAFLRLAVYVPFAICLAELRYLQENLRALAETRARALSQEATRSWQLERAIKEVEERERRRIGQNLHDGICQHLAATALAARLVADDLKDTRARNDARRVLELVEEGIMLTRAVAKDLYPIETCKDGLTHALEQLAAKTKRISGVDCRFVCDLPILVAGSSIAANLYHIAQESINNAIRHGHATQIEILLEETESGIKLRIRDNGSGLPVPLPKSNGMGLRLMADRARAIGGHFFLRPGTEGAEAVCIIPVHRTVIG